MGKHIFPHLVKFYDFGIFEKMHIKVIIGKQALRVWIMIAAASTLPEMSLFWHAYIRCGNTTNSTNFSFFRVDQNSAAYLLLSHFIYLICSNTCCILIPQQWEFYQALKFWQNLIDPNPEKIPKFISYSEFLKVLEISFSSFYSLQKVHSFIMS